MQVHVGPSRDCYEDFFFSYFREIGSQGESGAEDTYVVSSLGFLG